ncbi:phosphate ABC transporter substrate-binding protein [Shigella phage SSP1]|uniref:Phosphate ABC transporter substrate-binding protein n=1 Tax=Shigella phage SSP1 TaxID=1983588 RepID=A0A2N9QQM0_9CAUD|nr:phosphate ABC transporter substrate-binding protein [Shigella phage SSP1]ASD50223.1 phosphate ABC transporter substrate-binding protein [Shigella phage SSP1]
MPLSISRITYTFLETPEFSRDITLLVGGSPKFLGTYTRRLIQGGYGEGGYF